MVVPSDYDKPVNIKEMKRKVCAKFIEAWLGNGKVFNRKQ